MSTTAQSEGQQSIQNPPDTREAPAAAAAPPAAAKQSLRSYTLFEEARQDTWTRLTEVDAGSEEDALNTLGEQKLKEAGKRFMAIPSRFVRPRKPKVDTVTTISYD